MQAPTSSDAYLDLLRKSNLADARELDKCLHALRVERALPADPKQLAHALVRKGLLTGFQASQLLAGKYRGFTLGKYRVLEQLGSGGMGNVYLCGHLFMRRRVAVKVLARSKAADPGTVDRFYREARAVAALDHPNIVRAHDVDQDGELHFLVMEYVDGSNLQEVVGKHGPLGPVRAAHYVSQAAVGLQHVHECGMIHRDIKPGNLLVDRQGVVKILDLGLACVFQDLQEALSRSSNNSPVLGTADYVSPEQARNSFTVDVRTDIYSLGATFYFLLAGQPPFGKGTAAQKLIWHQIKEPAAVRQARPEVPEELAAVVQKMMAKEVAQRYQTAQEVIEALKPWTQTPVAPPPEHEMPRLCPAARAAGSLEGGLSGGLSGIYAPLPGNGSSRHGGDAGRASGSSSTIIPPSRSEKTEPLPVALPAAPDQPGPPPTRGPRFPRVYLLAVFGGVLLGLGIATLVALVRN